ncbi:TRIC cation channel family protein [Corynebacterium aquatimens]|uniref:trimeric intracellular cation channel family protein n=1 Tax=Corynebacterium TaxID=1716 RepID=UPI001F287C52|nr:MULTISPECIES: trimeric intracellular cation channel family protein [Corynebacterium]QYH20176.1 TRIC cation channel family protein [Corynebacterium aquatimens]UIZ92577.1 TRIC cation channel family protein [Corynebacterium sp. CNCTC7651]
MTVDQVDPLIASIYRWFDVSGVLIMSIIGGTIARQRGYDIVGFFFIAMLSALGGGMLRDVLINQGSVAAMREPEYLILALTGALIARFTYFSGRTWHFVETHGDALISALWASTGTTKAIAYNLPVLPSILMGVLTATGGSMIRDVVTGREPAVFGNNQPTVVPAVACSIVALVGNATGYAAWGLVLGPVVSFALFLVGYYGNWRMSTTQVAPINETAAQVTKLARIAERRSRAVARGLEPKAMRAWRHRQMEKALARRIEAEVQRGKRREQAESDADEFLAEFTDDLAEQELVEGKDASKSEMLDMILSDDVLTDELIERLVARYQARGK